MIFEGLSLLKRNAMMTFVLLLCFGIVMLMLPVKYLPALIEAIGSVMIIIALGLVFDFLAGKKSLINFVIFTGALILGIAGAAVLIYQSDMLFVMGWLFGAVFVVEGIHGIYHTYVYARRSGRSGWKFMIALFALLLLCGLVIFINPWWHNADSFQKMIGWLIIISAIISGLRLRWLWPRNKMEEVSGDAE